ncbi:hypothetical protein EKD04_000275 [Chloroflexales bacterium ZM16-3]|nr:hypothetical protein [Chloroflexales bacterium ZM16-3]
MSGLGAPLDDAVRAGQGRRFCIYYGWLVADAAGMPSPSALRPDLLVAPAYTAEPQMRNLSAPVMDLLRRQGVEVLAYVDAAFGHCPFDEVLSSAAEAMALGVGGVLFEQVEHRWSPASHSYYGTLAEGVRAGGGRVALNTGVAATDEALMSVADLLMLEHGWRAFAELSPWRRRYDPLRFMGVSSNEPGAESLLGHRLDSGSAARDARDAWAMGVGWHCATDRYIELPPWL